jgi:NTP pyrophosphatase (non-canonical NTP hydrolase)
VCVKFPGVCGQCTHNPCDCGFKRRLLESARDKSFSNKKLEQQRRLYAKKSFSAFTVHEWSSMFYEIFGEGIYQLSLQDITFHFMEEVGEVSSLLLQLLNSEAGPVPRDSTVKKTEAKLMAEIADVFSWMNSVSIKLGLLSTGFTETTFRKRVETAQRYLVNSIVAEYEEKASNG